jgi:RNA polymerase sigma factor (sigma-70 family)
MTDQRSEYELLIEPIEGRMMRSVWRILRDPDQVEDAFQDALVAIWKHWGEVRRHPNPEALVLRMCVNAAYDVLRKNAARLKRQEAGEAAQHIPDSSPSALEEMACAEQSRLVLRAIGTLPGNQARAILLHAVEEIPYPDIALAMHCREATVRKHVARARAKLRVLLALFLPPNRKEEGIHA